tara:strand:+ start:1943 stop:2086 length:144 start_codon:yes stop_codon:yes gene_type:complete
MKELSLVEVESVNGGFVITGTMVLYGIAAFGTGFAVGTAFGEWLKAR